MACISKVLFGPSKWATCGRGRFGRTTSGTCSCPYFCFLGISSFCNRNSWGWSPRSSILSASSRTTIAIPPAGWQVPCLPQTCCLKPLKLVQHPALQAKFLDSNFPADSVLSFFVHTGWASTSERLFMAISNCESKNSFIIGQLFAWYRCHYWNWIDWFELDLHVKNQICRFFDYCGPHGWLEGYSSQTWDTSRMKHLLWGSKGFGGRPRSIWLSSHMSSNLPGVAMTMCGRVSRPAICTPQIRWQLRSVWNDWRGYGRGGGKPPPRPWWKSLSSVQCTWVTAANPGFWNWQQSELWLQQKARAKFLVYLPILISAANQDLGSQAANLVEGPAILCDLQSQLSGGHKNQGDGFRGPGFQALTLLREAG